MSEYWYIVSSSSRRRREPDTAENFINFNGRWRAAIKEAARANYNSLMVKKACEEGEANLDDLVEARRWKETADAALSASGREYRRQKDT